MGFGIVSPRKVIVEGEKTLRRDSAGFREEGGDPRRHRAFSRNQGVRQSAGWEGDRDRGGGFAPASIGVLDHVPDIGKDGEKSWRRRARCRSGAQKGGGVIFSQGPRREGDALFERNPKDSPGVSMTKERESE